MSSHKQLRDITNAELLFEQPIDEDLMLRMVENMFELASMIDGQSDQQFKAQASVAPVGGLLTIDTITSGFFVRDDQYNTSYILVTSGTASGKGEASRFKITDSDESAQTFTCAVNVNSQTLQAAGMGNNDTFEVMGHTHDGEDGALIASDSVEYLIGALPIEYLEAGKSQTRTGTGGPFGNTHTLVLPTLAENYLITMSFKLSTTGAGSAEILHQDAAVTTTILQDVAGAGQHKGGTISLIAVSGDLVIAHHGFSSTGGTMFATFDILSIVKLQ